MGTLELLAQEQIPSPAMVLPAQDNRLRSATGGDYRASEGGSGESRVTGYTGGEELRKELRGAGGIDKYKSFIFWVQEIQERKYKSFIFLSRPAGDTGAGGSDWRKYKSFIFCFPEQEFRSIRRKYKSFIFSNLVGGEVREGGVRKIPEKIIRYKLSPFPDTVKIPLTAIFIVDRVGDSGGLRGNEE